MKRYKNTPVYLDPSRQVDARVADLLNRMTIEEKVRQLSMRHLRFTPRRKWRVSAKNLVNLFGDLGCGILEDPRQDPAGSAESVNQIQKYLVEKTRLGIPALVYSESVHGHFSGGATMFPQVIGQASTWNTKLIGQMAAVIGKEANAVGVRQTGSPDLDLARDPRWGRVEETFGEDPYLASRFGVAFIKGMQGPGPELQAGHIFCMVKHYAAHGSPEGGLNVAPVEGGIRQLRTVYLPPFEAAVKAGITAVMPCYSEYDGVPAAASKLLLTTVLRDEWGFQGFVFADYTSIEQLMTLHKTAGSAAEAGKQALEAGMDVEAPDEICYGDNLVALVRQGEVSEDRVDEAVSRVLRVKFLAGIFENPYADPKEAVRVVNAPGHRQLALEIAQEAIILLKNDNALLPLGRSIGRIAVIGPNADAAQLGDYSTAKPTDVSPLQGIRDAVSKRTKVVYAQGCEVYAPCRDGFDEAIEAATTSDVAIVVLGGDSQSTWGEGWGYRGDAIVQTCGELFDRSSLNPPGLQRELVKEIVATGTPTIVVMLHGRCYSIEWIAEHVPAIIEAWYPGEEGGRALADILFGKINPSGKLPVSVPRTAGHLPAFYNHKPSARGHLETPEQEDAIDRGYVLSKISPLFPFGYGLSYTTFRYSNLRISPGKIKVHGHVKVRVDVRNTGKVKGKEVVQLYVNDVVSTVTTPVKALRGFEKVELKPGQKMTVEFDLGFEDLKLLDHNMNWVVEPGQFEVLIDTLRKTFEVV
jgi:beta-glucosidase